MNDSLFATNLDQMTRVLSIFDLVVDAPEIDNRNDMDWMEAKDVLYIRLIRGNELEFKFNGHTKLVYNKALGKMHSQISTTNL